MMELSLMTFSMMKDAALKSLNAETLCGLAKDNGVFMLDLMDFEVNLYKEKELIKAMAKSGISCGCLIVTPPFFDAPQKVEKKLRQSFELCGRLGADTLMVVPGITGLDKKACLKMSRWKMIDLAIGHYRLAVRMGEEFGIKVGFENTPADYKPFCSPEECRVLLDEVPGLGMIFDTGNFRVADPQADELAAYEQLKDRIIRVHLKDVALGRFQQGEACRDGQKIQAVTTGSGIIPMEDLIRRLKEDDYQGVAAIEYAAPQCDTSQGIAPQNVKGKQHSPYIGTYVRYIRGVYDGSRKTPPYAHIEGIDKPVSRIFFGTAIMPMLMGKTVDGLLDAVLSSGINTFDCARGYGSAEKTLGSWMKRRNNRERVIILSKCGNVNLKGEVRVDREVIEKELEKSLVTLGTDYIDIYLLHRDDPKTPVSEFIECLNEAKRQGKIRVFGVSNWTHQRIEEANRYAEEHGLDGFSVSSPNFGLARQMEDPWGGECVTISGPENQEARDWYAESGMPVIAYSSLGRGFFSGKFRSGDYEAAKKVLDKAAQKGYLHKENMHRLFYAERIAKRDHMSVPQVAMRYIFSHPMNVFAVVSTTNPGRLEQNIEAANSPLDLKDVFYLEQD